MFDALKSVLTIVVVIAIVVMVIGLIWRSNLRAARLFGWFMIAWAVAVILIEGYDWQQKGDWVVTPAAQLWYQIDRDSLNGMQSAIEHYLMPALWLPVDWALQMPAWLMLTLLGLGLLVIDHFQMMRMHKGSRPLPLWRRLYVWLRDMNKRAREERA